MAADRLLSTLRELRSHQALVIDTAGAVVGLITLEDVVGELLGGVGDEFKTSQLRAIRLSDGRLRVPGMMRVDQVAALLPGWPPGQGSVTSAIVTALGRLPEPGEHVVVNGTDLEIEVVDNGVVASVIAGPRPADAGEDA